MHYKVGDEVFVKAKVVFVDVTDRNLPYNVVFEGVESWMEEKEIYPCTDKTYVDGLNDAWELAKKIRVQPGDGGIPLSEIEDVFGTLYVDTIFKNNTYEEALAKIEAYEKGKAEIKVGDVVRASKNGFDGLVTAVKCGEAFVMYDDGSCTSWSVKDLTKTGKHIDIESLLKQIGE